MSEPVWLTTAEIVAINRRLLQGSPENHFLRNLAALESAAYRPRFHAEYSAQTSISWLACCLIQAIGKAHAFEQGNKRTAWVAGRYFIAINGYRLSLTGQQQEHLKFLIEDLIIGDHDPALLADEIEPLLEPA
ncbi:type II toxin-antitoxin system death-on-curing family toxin [Rhizobium sp. G187]|uniref:type II toxin-antitoxin system death-on-curing family toxin n=1 Tax=Rhizobium sp. G187 TaxID=3451352 RepID=UPI003EE658A1